MTLDVEHSAYDRMVTAARMAAPLEACGLCGGRDGRVTRCFVLTNLDASAERFRMSPEEQFAAVKAMRSAGMQMLAIWHSHPATPARMSEADLRLAYTPSVVYLILSLAIAGSPVLRGFTVNDGVAEAVTVRVRPE